MDFRTIVEPDKVKGLISHRSGILTLGSCFADNIGEKLEREMFHVRRNPFGPLYNPSSIYQTVSRMALADKFSEDELFESGGLWRSWNSHTKLAGSDRKTVADRLNEILLDMKRYTQEAGTAILTFGTAFVFRLKDTGRIVANCHKMPGTMFERRLLTPEECVLMMTQTVETLRMINPDINLVMTVSPVRHTADGAHGNFISKATLALAVDETLKKYGNVYYFPSYEIMTDDLRDYRFYAEDMKHPSEQAVAYIYERFKEAYFDEKTMELARKARVISLRKAHRLTEGTDETTYDKFQKVTEQMEDDLIREHPYLAQIKNNNGI
ncbi:MAG: GSCFA domain-containing protein [Paramuribaculum sp.]|nr:GSCFA domain-containing protein [Paramuribaculum sp.]